MNVKPIPLVPSYQVNTANETSEEERREREKKRKGNSVNAVAPSTPPAEEKENSSLKSEPESISCQILDSEKIVELLSRPPRNYAKPSAFKKSTTNTPPNPLSPTPKKLNRAL